MSIKNLDKSIDKLIKRYKETYLYALHLLKYQIDKGLNERQARLIIREIQLELKGLDEAAYKWTHDVLPEYYYVAAGGVDTEVAKLKNINVIKGNSSVIHKKALEQAVNNTYADLAKNTRYMEQQAKQIIRNNSEEILTRMIITGESQKTVKKELKDKLVSQGVTSFVDAGKKQWKIEQYSNILVRTKSRILHSDGTFNRLLEYQSEYPNERDNFDLVQISTHYAEDWCRYYEGTVYSISGRSSEYPPVSSLPNGYSILHPNCKHVFLAYIPALRGEGLKINDRWLNKSVKDLNKLDYHLRKKA